MKKFSLPIMTCAFMCACTKSGPEASLIGKWKLLGYQSAPLCDQDDTYEFSKDGIYTIELTKVACSSEVNYSYTYRINKDTIFVNHNNGIGGVPWYIVSLTDNELSIKKPMYYGTGVLWMTEKYVK